MTMGRRLRVIIEADGGARGNPGPAGYGAVVREANTGEVLSERSASIGVATNNVAEYMGMVAGLEAAAELGAVEVEVRMDSRLVVEQMSGRWQIKHPGLRPLAARAADLVRRFDRVTFEWIPRERNRDADALANAAMDAAAAAKAANGLPAAAAKAANGLPAASRPTGDARPKAEPLRVAAGSRAGSGAPAGSSVSGSSLAAARALGSKGAWAPPTARPTRLILVRHGETELTAQQRYSGRGDVPLNPFGLAQAEATAARVAALAPMVAAVVTSPLSRCRRTAELIAEAVGGVPVRAEQDLIECDFGEWEGLTFADVRQRWRAELDAWLDSTHVAPPGGESFQEVAVRVHRVVAGIHAAVPAGNVVVVSHVSPLKLILRDVLAADDAMLHRLYLDPCGVSIVDMWADGAVAVRAVNDTAHLPRR